MAYAETTSVPIEKTKAEIDSILMKAGATHQGIANSPEGAMVFFFLNERKIVFKLPLPDRNAPEFCEYLRGRTRYERTQAAALKAWEQACRSRWRALFLCIKAKLESVDSGIETFEDAFLAQVVMPDGQSFSEYARPAIAKSYQDNGPPRLTFGG